MNRTFSVPSEKPLNQIESSAGRSNAEPASCECRLNFFDPPLPGAGVVALVKKQFPCLPHSFVTTAFGAGLAEHVARVTDAGEDVAVQCRGGHGRVSLSSVVYLSTYSIHPFVKLSISNLTT